MDRWTKEVRIGADYYNFVEYFLVLIMSLITPIIIRLSVASQLHLWMPHGKIGDWFFAKEGTFIRLYGFLRAPFFLPIHVTN